MTNLPRVLIYGSCVSRDVVRLAPLDFELVYYIARQSWVSSNSALTPNPGPTVLGNGFQQRSLLGDFASNATSLISRFSDQTDVLLMDIASDRRGVYEIDPEQMVSFTGELGRSKLLSKYPNRRFVPFGSERHFQLFKDAADRIGDLLTETNLMSRSYILKFEFTDISDSGEPVPSVLNTSGAEWNGKYQRYYSYLLDRGFKLLELPRRYSISMSTHEWGIGQDHFIDDAYSWWRDSVLAEYSSASEDN